MVPKPTAPDPAGIALSTSVYSILLRGYPRSFRQTYGPHMAQVFRDSCLKAHRQSGPAGLPALWAATLIDWFKSVLEEQLNRDTEMTRIKFVRLGGWALMLAGLIYLLTFLQLDPDRIRIGLYRLFGAPATREAYTQYVTAAEAVGMLAYFCAVLLTAVGLLSLLARYGERTGRLGSYALGISAASGAVALLGIIALIAGVETARTIMFYGITVMFAMLFTFGILARRQRIMSRGSALPILAGFWLPFILIRAELHHLLTGSWPNVTFGLSFAMFAAMSLSLAALGYVLQSDLPTPAARTAAYE